MTEIMKIETTPIANISDFVQIKDEQVYTTSRIVAEKFGKEHYNVLKAIEATINDITSVQSTDVNFNAVNFNVVKNYFISDSYVDAKGETRKQYLITEDGLALLVMGFGGVNAMRVKLKFVAEFNRMKNIINNPAQVIAETGSLDALVAFGVTNQRFTNALVKAKQEQQLLEQQKREAEETIANQKMAIQTKLVPYCNQLVAKSERLQEENENLIDEVKTTKNDYDGLYNSFVSVEHWMMMKEVSDRLAIKKMGRNNLYKFLQEIHVLDSANRPYHHYVDMGYFKVADTIKRTGDWVRTYTYPMVSKKGLVFIEKMLRKNGYC